VIDVPDRPDIHVGFGSIKFFFGHTSFASLLEFGGSTPSILKSLLG
jgi:hypothetical protein